MGGPIVMGWKGHELIACPDVKHNHYVRQMTLFPMRSLKISAFPSTRLAIIIVIVIIIVTFIIIIIIIIIFTIIITIIIVIIIIIILLLLSLSWSLSLL